MVGLMRAATAENPDADQEGVTVRDNGLAFLDPRRLAARSSTTASPSAPSRGFAGFAR
jgi:hypothetical protein